jgi:hypothetical protein
MNLFFKDLQTTACGHEYTQSATFRGARSIGIQLVIYSLGPRLASAGIPHPHPSVRQPSESLQKKNEQNEHPGGAKIAAKTKPCGVFQAKE